MDTLVGSPLIKGISGGEKKRTSIAFELISDPDLLILDEPTSGLDSLTSFIIIQYLSAFAKENNKTVIMTIHQPNSDFYELFDTHFLMVEGRLLYQGRADEAVRYFDTQLGLKCPGFYNPADYLISIIHPDSPENVIRYPAFFSRYNQVLAPSILDEIKARKTHLITKRTN